MPFSIHQFSSGIINPTINQKGEWVSQGYESEIANESHPVPEEIEQAVNTTKLGGWRGFGIPDAYPPKPGQIALIARDLGTYCVLAVANIQKDEGNRPFIAYRYFWLDKTQFSNHFNQQDCDGIGTLLLYWQQRGKPQYNIGELHNKGISYTTSWNNLEQVLLFKNWQQQHYQRIQSLINDIRPSQQPLIYEATEIRSQLTYQEVHCLAIEYCTVNGSYYINWAWNVRRLENPKGLKVIYCADAETFNWFNRQFPFPVIAPTQMPRQSLEGGITKSPVSRRGASVNQSLKECLKIFRNTTFTAQDILDLINYYQNNEDNIFESANELDIKKFIDESNPQPFAIQYATLITALAPNETQPILNKLIRLNQQDKQVAIQFLVDVKQRARDNKLCYEHEYFLYFSEDLSKLQDKLLESLEPKPSNFSPSSILKQITQSKPPFWAWIFFFLLLSGLIYWQKSNILSISLWGHKIDIPNKNSTENPATNPSQQTNNANPNLVFLLNMYEKTFDAVKIGKDPKIDLSRSESLQSISTAIQKSTEEILNILNENQQLLIDLKSEYPKVIQEARKPGKYPIYNDLKQFTTLNSAKIEDLPNLSLGNQENDALSVNMLQEALKRGDYYTAGKEYTPGIFDEATQNAVTSAQTQAEFSEDEITGFVGEKTWSNILKDRLQDLQLEAVYLTLKDYLKQSNPTYNIVTEIKKCRDNNKDQNALHFNKCLENIGKSTTPSNKGTESG